MEGVKSRLHSDEARWVCVYPLYINAKKTTAQGRKVDREKAVENPTQAEILDVLNYAGLNCKLERNKMHPKDPNRDANLQGRVRVQLKNEDGSPLNPQFPTRKSLLLYACEMIPKLKTRAGGGGSAITAQPAGSKGKSKKKR